MLQPPQAPFVYGHAEAGLEFLKPKGPMLLVTTIVVYYIHVLWRLIKLFLVQTLFHDSNYSVCHLYSSICPLVYTICKIPQEQVPFEFFNRCISVSNSE